MTGWGSPEWLWSLAALPMVAALLGVAWAARRRALARFADVKLHRALGIHDRRLIQFISACLLLASLACVAIGLARPHGNPRSAEGKATGRDVVFVVDVSRSMLATDLTPTRLERAKLWIKDVSATLQGDRVAIVAFAGTSVVKCPLTLDYTFFSLALDELTPSSVSRGGTNIGDAIRRTLDDVFDTSRERPRDLILITDGDDQESFPVQAAEQAGERGVRIIALGLGDSATGAAVPAEGSGVLRYKGERVLSKQDSGSLASIAQASAGGVYFNVGTGTIELDRVYRDLVQSAAGSEIEAPKTTVYDEYFQPWLAAAALGLLAERVMFRRMQKGAR